MTMVDALIPPRDVKAQRIILKILSSWVFSYSNVAAGIESFIKSEDQGGSSGKLFGFSPAVVSLARDENFALLQKNPLRHHKRANVCTTTTLNHNVNQSYFPKVRCITLWGGPEGSWWKCHEKEERPLALFLIPWRIHETFSASNYDLYFNIQTKRAVAKI